MPESTRELRRAEEVLLLLLLLLLLTAVLGPEVASLWVATSVSETVARAGTGEFVNPEEAPVDDTAGFPSRSESGR